MKAEELGAWQALLQEELEKPYWRTLSERVDAAYAAAAVYPPREALFAAFRLTPPEAVRAVILGQDPYHEPGQANGLAFSVNPGVKLPPSLRNLFTELQSDCGITPPDSGDLTAWAKQGVFLLNSSLTVEAGKAASHKDFGWQTFTDAVVQRLAALPQPVAFVLWYTRTEKGRDCSPQPISAPRPASPAPERFKRLPGLFRQQTVFADQCVSRAARSEADRLAAIRTANQPNFMRSKKKFFS